MIYKKEAVREFVDLLNKLQRNSAKDSRTRQIVIESHVEKIIENIINEVMNRMRNKL